ncbi:hypothetical protein TD95_000655 [Thielaviopsis punctulata]|uniref:Putative phospholipase n=1 Tax=Thielaviopsis punctulata TaxID=72032 RepID=A0A0F4ZK34_9PEZI|nr:hypothetical protein TD95_000655 [Thielaviopsis punctulata]
MIPYFPDYTGPYRVGTVDIEVPITELASPAPAPSNAAEIRTILVRVYYPAEPNTGGRKIHWLPTPQRQNVSAYAQFMGLGPTLSGVVSYLPRHMYYTTIPAYKNATISTPKTPSGRWPTAIFSHGLAGCRNSYSYIAGSLASYGIVVFCPEHRDGSAVLTMERNPATKVGRFTPWRDIAKTHPYIRIEHDATPEVFQARANQLRIRTWEMGLVHACILAMDRGNTFTNLNQSTCSLDQFKEKMDVHEPGKIIFMGHSFGAATMVQFLKSVYYAESPELKDFKAPLYTPSRSSEICAQVTPKSITILLDIWCMPLFDPSMSALLHLPLPVYAPVVDAPGGTALLAVESEQFYKWTEHLHATARVLSPQPSARIVDGASFVNPATQTSFTPARFFWVERSAHLNQSDFGVLFPWVTKKVFSADEPERALRLNLRAQLQVLRDNGVAVAKTSFAECLDGGQDDFDFSQAADGRVNDDSAIFRDCEEGIDAWAAIDIIGMGDKSPVLGWNQNDGADSGAETDDATLKGGEQAEAVESAVAPAQIGAVVA